MILDRGLHAAGDDDDVLDAGFEGLGDDIVEHRAIDDGQKLLGDALGGRSMRVPKPAAGMTALRILLSLCIRNPRECGMRLIDPNADGGNSFQSRCNIFPAATQEN